MNDADCFSVQALMKNATDAMKESRVHDFLTSVSF